MVPSIPSTDKSVCATWILPYPRMLLDARDGVAQTLLSVLSQDAATDIAIPVIAAPPNTRLLQRGPSRLPRDSASASAPPRPSLRRLRASHAPESLRNPRSRRCRHRRAPVRSARRDLSPTTPQSATAA